jgi:hypothetical protein
MINIQLAGLMFHLRKDRKEFALSINIPVDSLRKMLIRNSVKISVLEKLEKKYTKKLVKKFLFNSKKQGK